jgi:hypothetical protein
MRFCSYLSEQIGRVTNKSFSRISMTRDLMSMVPIIEAMDENADADVIEKVWSHPTFDLKLLKELAYTTLLGCLPSTMNPVAQETPPTRTKRSFRTPTTFATPSPTVAAAPHETRLTEFALPETRSTLGANLWNSEQDLCLLREVEKHQGLGRSEIKWKEIQKRHVEFSPWTANQIRVRNKMALNVLIGFLQSCLPFFCPLYLSLVPTFPQKSRWRILNKARLKQTLTDSRLSE